jgi:hypothetical protein
MPVVSRSRRFFNDIGAKQTATGTNYRLGRSKRPEADIARAQLARWQTADDITGQALEIFAHCGFWGTSVEFVRVYDPFGVMTNLEGGAS